MKFKSSMLVVDNLAASQTFYRAVLGLRTVSDLGGKVMLATGIVLQSKDYWLQTTGKPQQQVAYQGNDCALTFEEKNFDSFLNKLATLPDLIYFQQPFEQEWGQRVVRFYDLDGHIIEVGEEMKAVCKRFLKQGLSVEETALRTHFPSTFVRSCLK